jgi:hypothetical protein
MINRAFGQVIISTLRAGERQEGEVSEGCPAPSAIVVSGLLSDGIARM